MHTKSCPVCHGTGALGHFSCGRCHGTGRVWSVDAPLPGRGARLAALVAALMLAGASGVGLVVIALEVLR